MDNTLTEVVQIGTGVGVFGVMLALTRAAYRSWTDAWEATRDENERLRKENEALRRELGEYP